MRPHVGEGDLRRLLHDVPELPGEGQPVTPAVDGGRLDVQDIASSTGHRQPSGHTWHGSPVSGFEEVTCPSQPPTHIAYLHVNRGSDRSGGQLRGDLAQQLPELPLERADAGLTGVVRHDRAQGVVTDGHFVEPERSPLELAGEEVMASLARE